MNKSYKTLEFDKILNKLADYTASESVKDKILHLEPFGDIEKAKNAQKETSEAVSALLRRGTPPVSLSLKNILGAVKRADIGGVLSPKDLLEISRVLYVSGRMRTYLDDCGEDLPIISAIGKSLISHKREEDKINSAILSENEIADSASAALSSIRRKTKALNANIRETLNKMIRSEHYKKYLQDAIVTVRADRFVIPVKAEYRSEVGGIVHDTSSSGSTLFIEPMSIVNMNNEIRDLQNKEEQEIQRILAELSADVALIGSDIKTDYELINELDFIFCKGKLSLDYDGTEPTLNTDGIIEFKHARHPLISKDRVVANDIYLGENFDTLVITGPNTGGKTVTLKTIGLFSIMAASGLHLPVRDGSRAAVFSDFFADIGDEQSIEQSLSTFSSHMVNIVNILKNVNENSLALFDELGAGTDPTEGAALAISVLEHLRTIGAKTVATTHYSELKLFALSTDGVENASCEFNVESLKPTYKLLIGIPGKSNAFAISRRLGLGEDIIGRANELLSDENIRFEDVISDLEQNRIAAQYDKEYALRLKREITELKKEVDSERRRLKENKSKILEDARREAKIIVMEARDEANDVIKELERMRQKGAVKNLDDKASKVREKLKKKEDTLDSQMAKAAKPRKIYRKEIKDLKIGDTVKIVDMDQEASVMRLPDKNGMVRVQAGIINMDVHITGLARVEDKTSKELADKYVKSRSSYISKTKNVSTEIDLRGQTLDEAVMNTEKFLDDCYLAGISPVTIIHGKGTGILRKGIHEMLKKHKYVKSFRLGTFGEGEDGITIAELK